MIWNYLKTHSSFWRRKSELSALGLSIHHLQNVHIMCEMFSKWCKMLWNCQCKEMPDQKDKDKCEIVVCELNILWIKCSRRMQDESYQRDIALYGVQQRIKPNTRTDVSWEIFLFIKKYVYLSRNISLYQEIFFCIKKLFILQDWFE